MKEGNNMTSFYNVLINSIKNNYKTKERTYFENVIAKWSLNGWLTDEEVTNALALLDTLYGVSIEEAPTI